MKKTSKSTNFRLTPVLFIFARSALFSLFCAFSAGIGCYMMAQPPKRMVIIMIVTAAASLALSFIGISLRVPFLNSKSFGVRNLAKSSALALFGFLLIRRFGRRSLGGVVGALCGVLSFFGLFVPELFEVKTLLSVAYFVLLVIYSTAKSLLELLGFNQNKNKVKRHAKS